MDLPREVDQRIHNPDSDSSHKTSESVDLTNLDSTDYGCEIHLLDSYICLAVTAANKITVETLTIVCIK